MQERKSAVSEHAWKEHHPIRWQKTSVIDRASRSGELRVKEALHIHLSPEDQCFNRNCLAAGFPLSRLSPCVIFQLSFVSPWGRSEQQASTLAEKVS